MAGKFVFLLTKVFNLHHNKCIMHWVQRDSERRGEVERGLSGEIEPLNRKNGRKQMEGGERGRRSINTYSSNVLNIFCRVFPASYLV